MALMLLCDHRAIDGAREAQFLNFGRDRCLPHGKTVITLRQLHPTKAQRDAGIGFGAVEFGYQTLDKLARHVESSSAASNAGR